MSWVLWALLLLLQNASFTLVSRARNSQSLLYHAMAGLGSNGVWFLSQLVLVDKTLSILKSGSWREAAFTAAFYTTFTLIGSVGMHWFALHKIERRPAAKTPMRCGNFVVTGRS